MARLDPAVTQDLGLPGALLVVVLQSPRGPGDAGAGDAARRGRRRPAGRVRRERPRRGRPGPRLLQLHDRPRAAPAWLAANAQRGLQILVDAALRPDLESLQEPPCPSPPTSPPS